MIQINKIKPLKCKAYSPEGKYLGLLNEYEFNDLLIQIKEENISGYYSLYKKQKIDLLPSGRIEFQPKGFFDLIEEQLSKLMGF